MRRAQNSLQRFPLPLALGLILLAVVATGCEAPERTLRASNQWSNGRLLGTAILNNRVGLQVDGTGSAFVVWVGLDHELYFARLNERAEMVVQKTLDLQGGSAHKPQLLLDSLGQLHLSWLGKRSQGLRLFYARLTTDGEVIQGATALSSAGQQAAHSSMVLDSVGQTVEFFWSNASGDPGCYHAALDWSGELVVPPEMLVPDGILPVAQVGRRGFVHLAWREESAQGLGFYYAAYDPQRRELGPSILASEPLVQTSLLGGPTAAATFDGPFIGLDESAVYLAWVVEVRERGESLAFTFYQAFPQPALDSREDAASSAKAFDYAPPEVTNMPVHVQGADPTSTGQPRFLEGQPTQQKLACYTRVSQLGGAEMLQVAVVDLREDEVVGHEIVNASSSASLRPSAVIGPADHLHLAWIDTAGFNRYRVVYASNSPQAKETLNRITAYDVVDRILTTVMSALTAIFFAPVALAWVIGPLVWLIAFSWLTGESDGTSLYSLGALGLAMLLHLGVKLGFFSDLLSRFPFGALFSSSSVAFLVGRWIFPVFLAVLSAGLTWIYLRRERGRSIFAAYFVYAIFDSFITLVVYAAFPTMT